MKILALEQVVYDTYYHGYTTEDIFFEISDIACVQNYSSLKECGKVCQIWLKGRDDFFVVKGTAKEIIEKMRNCGEIS